MKNKLTILVEEKNIRFAKKYAREIIFFSTSSWQILQQKTARKKMVEKDEWVEKYAGIFNTGKKDLLQDFDRKK